LRKNLKLKLTMSPSTVMAAVDMSDLLSCLSAHRLGVFFALALVLRVFYRRYWTPIRDIPGPFFASFGSLWKVYHVVKGHTEEEIIKLHKKHGALPTLEIFDNPLIR
jgi:hypothetical protein